MTEIVAWKLSEIMLKEIVAWQLFEIMATNGNSSIAVI
jgi:hypothetical protein